MTQEQLQKFIDWCEKCEYVRIRLEELVQILEEKYTK